MVLSGANTDVLRPETFKLLVQLHIRASSPECQYVSKGIERTKVQRATKVAEIAPEGKAVLGALTARRPARS